MTEEFKVELNNTLRSSDWHLNWSEASFDILRALSDKNQPHSEDASLLVSQRQASPPTSLAGVNKTSNYELNG